MRAAAEPYSGVVVRAKGFLPRLDEVKAFCEERERAGQRSQEFEERSRRQLAERAEFETGPRKLPQRIMDELSAHGLTNRPQLRNIETPGKVMAKYGLTQAQWDAIPNAK